MATVNPLLQQIDAIAKEKGVEPDIIISAVQDALEAAARKRYKSEALRARFNQETGQLELYAVKRIVEEGELGETALAQQYTLEVSSPGLDRPLRHEADYRRFAGRLAKVVTTEPLDGQSAFAGRLRGVEEGHVVLDEGRRTHRVPLGRIKRAQLAVEFR